MKKRLTDQQKIEIVRLYQQNESTKVIAEKFGIRRSSVLGMLRRRGVKLRPKCKWNKYTFDTHFFDVIDSQEKAYVLGFLFADGNNYARYRKISVELNSKDEDVLLKIKTCLKSDYNLYEWFRTSKITGKTSRYLRFEVCDKHFSERCSELGLVPRKSAILTFPDASLVPEALVNHFVRGYFDGDGSISYSPEKGRYAYISFISSKQFCESLKTIVWNSLGKMGNVIKNKDSEGMAYFRISGNGQCLRFLKWLYYDASIFLDRKYNKYKFFEEDYTKKVKENDEERERRRQEAEKNKKQNAALKLQQKLEKMTGAKVKLEKI